ncbi:pleckstrin homology domain-containing family G member 5-like [Branchiostoma floridae]|uniref:Pleckstrin homology domain-containing family G member 5-like n=1 Tax=Branchiostoma floridae TaxID=7739 RepID=A0A9J7MFD0_BRAFL|nr:pleckstrin homology domain-containing family G member 5-like [Branchiostoma floridae]
MPEKAADLLRPEAKDGSMLLCQNPSCSHRRRASKVCHHAECKEKNNKHPLNLCDQCDNGLHSGQHFDGHLRFDLPPQGTGLARNVSTRSCPPGGVGSDQEEEEQDNETERTTSSYGPQKDFKLSKKKTARRHHTDDPSREFFTVKFDIADYETEIVPAVKGKTLRDALAGMMDRRGLTIDHVNIYLDQSSTPLPLHFETYPLGGHSLHVKGKEPLKDSDTGLTKTGLHSAKGNVMTAKLKTLSQSKEDPTGSRRSSGAYRRAFPKAIPRRRTISTSSMFYSDRQAETWARHQMNQNNKPSEAFVRQAPENGTVSGVFPLYEGGNLTFVKSQRSRKNIMSILGSSQDVGPLSPREGSDRSRTGGRFSALFNPGAPVANEKSEHLAHKLSTYALYGLPKLPSLIWFYNRDEDESIYELEASWTEIVEDKSNMTKKQMAQQEALWELVSTEVSYIKGIRVVVDLFMCCLINLQNEALLCEIDTEKLFSNIQEVEQCNSAFWQDHMCHVVTKARQRREPLKPSDMEEGFLEFEEMFQPYVKYCMEEEACVAYMKDKFRDNDLFKQYVEWGESQKQCQRLKLGDLLVKPMQRITKYTLLLKAILKKTEEPSERESLVRMIDKVETFVTKVNTTLRQRHEQQRLASIIARIESYDAVEPGSDEVDRLLGQYCQIDLTAPMPGAGMKDKRYLLYEGPMKLKDGKDSKVDVYGFLFTDMLLITKPIKRGSEKFKVIKQPMIMDRIVLRELKDPGSFLLVYLNEYNLATAAYMMQAVTPGKGKSWIEAIRNARKSYETLCLRTKCARTDTMTLVTSTEEENVYNVESDSDEFDFQLIPESPPSKTKRNSLTPNAEVTNPSVVVTGTDVDIPDSDMAEAAVSRPQDLILPMDTHQELPSIPSPTSPVRRRPPVSKKPSISPRSVPSIQECDAQNEAQMMYPSAESGAEMKLHLSGSEVLPNAPPNFTKELRSGTDTIGRSATSGGRRSLPSAQFFPDEATNQTVAMQYNIQQSANHSEPFRTYTTIGAIRQVQGRSSSVRYTEEEKADVQVDVRRSSSDSRMDSRTRIKDKSKSTSDLSHTLESAEEEEYVDNNANMHSDSHMKASQTMSDLKDGIASVPAPVAPARTRRKLSREELARIRRSLIMSTTVTASQV